MQSSQPFLPTFALPVPQHARFRVRPQLLIRSYPSSLGRDSALIYRRS